MWFQSTAYQESARFLKSLERFVRQFDGTLAQQQQQNYGSLVKQNLSDRHSVLPLALMPEQGFNSTRHIVWLNDIYYSELAVWGKKMCPVHIKHGWK